MPWVAVAYGMTSLPPVVLDAWSHVVESRAREVVLPDGCRDLIFWAPIDAAPQWFVSTLADAASIVDCAGGDFFAGYRLQPGAIIDEAALLASARDFRYPDAPRILPLLNDCVRLDERLTETLDILSTTRSIVDAARQLGLPERRLERLVVSATGRSPSFWKNLARARRAARALSGEESLSAIACDHGYSDQAHMSRDFRRWFGTSPARFRRDPDLAATIAASGYGQPTGVHSSTR